MGFLDYVLFDFNGVAGCIDAKKRPASLLAEYSPFSIEEVSEIITEIEKRPGGIQYGSDMELFRKEVCDKIKARKIKPEKFKKIWNECFRETTNMQKILETLRKKNIASFLVSDTNAWHWEAISRLPAIKKYFLKTGRFALSCQYGCLKKSGELYQKSSDNLGILLKQAIAIDDKIENLNAFKKIAEGNNGQIVYFNCYFHPIHRLENALFKKLGIV